MSFLADKFRQLQLSNDQDSPIDARRTLLAAAEGGEASRWMRVNDTYDRRDEYYYTMMSNVKSEFLDCLVDAKRGGGILLCGGGHPCRDVSAVGSCSCEFTLRLKEGANSGRTVGERSDWFAERAAELEGLKDNVIMQVDGEQLFWITRCEVEVKKNIQMQHESVVVTGQGMCTSGPSLQHCRDHQTFKVLLFAGDFASRYRAAADLLRGTAGDSKLEMAVLNPSKSVPGTFTTLTRKSLSARLRTEVMPINPAQLEAIYSFKNRVEVIHGPPGTGKSTTIFHALSGHLPSNAAAIVTCVCNQAVDAVAEKLADVQDPSRKGCIPMLVLGNPSRVGRTAADYLLDRQAEREELVVFMRHICDRILKKGVAGMKRVQDLRIGKLLGGVAKLEKSRLSSRQLAGIPGLKARALKSFLEDHDSDFVLRNRGGRDLTEAELEARWNALRAKQHGFKHTMDGLMLIEHIRVVMKVRLAMASAAATLLPVDREGRSKFGRGPTLWSIGSHLKSECARLDRAEKWLAFAIERAPHRVVRRTRVFLCTIPSSYKIEQLREEYPEDFANRLFVAICDEAAATAETYVPQLLQLAVENLMLLGDHKQLQPLVLALNHKEPEQKMVSRSLMERMLACGYQVKMLVTQYRMFDGLCAIVSDLFYKGKLVTAKEKLAQDEEEQQQRCSGGRFTKGAQVEVCWEDWKWYPAVVKRMHASGSYYVDCEGETVRIPAEWVRVPARGAQAVFQDARQRLRWFDSQGRETVVGTSYLNVMEVAKIRELLHTDAVLSKTTERVKVITLYKPQLQLLQSTCADIVRSRSNIEFVTVDACQGTEAPHIVLSTSRSKPNKIGFAKNPRRLNVAISRAIKSLTIVGSAHALCSDWNWSEVHKGIGLKGIVCRVDGEKLKQSKIVQWDKISQAAMEMESRRAKNGREQDSVHHFAVQPSKGSSGKGKSIPWWKGKGSIGFARAGTIGGAKGKPMKGRVSGKSGFAKGSSGACGASW